VGGTREIYPSQNDGAVLVSCDDAPAIAESSYRLLADETLRQALARGARRRAESAFDIRRTADRLVEVYRELLK
jgi:glycosyltransferase involved in cell wall biosynthesis